MIHSRVTKKPSTAEDQLEVTIDNGDLQLVNSLITAYSLKDANSLFKFAIASLLQANNNEGLFTIKTMEDTNMPGGKRKVLSQITPTADMLDKAPDA